MQVCSLIQLLVKKLSEDGAMLSLLLKPQSLACRSRGMRKIGLARSAPGEKLVAIYTCCRYGPDWAPWRQIRQTDISSRDGNEATIDLGLDANLKITSVTGISKNQSGYTRMLKAGLSDGASWGPHGDSGLMCRTFIADGRSERPSPSSPPMMLSHLSGDETRHAWILRFHWRPQ